MSKREYHVVLQDRGILALPPELRERYTGTILARGSASWSGR